MNWMCRLPAFPAISARTLCWIRTRRSPSMLRLQVGGVAQTVSVIDNTLHVETTSTQLGQVITGRQMTAVPLDGRSYTDLLSLQPGVAPADIDYLHDRAGRGRTILNPSGTLNPGTISVNGQREFANYFSVNGSDVEEDVNAGTAIIPNLDAIAEFRIITSNFDAEYGEFSGGQISVITKSGSNAFHGNAFDFLRNTDLDARNYFSPTRGAFRQNQFGGTFGGPDPPRQDLLLRRLSGTRQTQGIDTGTISVPSNADRTGNLLDFTITPQEQSDRFRGRPLFRQPAYAKVGLQRDAGEPYYVPGCTTRRSASFPTPSFLKVPGPFRRSACSSTSRLRIPPAAFATSAFNQTVRDDKGAVRVDANTRWGLLSGLLLHRRFRSR